LQNRHKCFKVSKPTEEDVIAKIRVVKFSGIYSPGNISKLGIFRKKFRKLKCVEKSIGKFKKFTFKSCFL